MKQPVVSVIIPTYNRVSSLKTTLEAISTSNYPKNKLDVIVINDGSEYSVETNFCDRFKFQLRFVEQVNSGATIARNNGAKVSSGDILLFLDDDIDLVPDAISNLVETLYSEDHAFAIGQLCPSPAVSTGIFSKIKRMIHPIITGNPCEVSFSECVTGILAIWQKDFQEIGGFQDPTGGWPNWDDVDFGYRASQKGFRLVYCPIAIGYHRDYSLKDLKTSCLRVERASRSAAKLFQRYPELYNHLPMFHDKSPISLMEDPPALLLQKFGHLLIAWKPVLSCLEIVVNLLENFAPSPAILIPLYRWINSSYILKGYRMGKKDIHLSKSV